MTTPSCLGLSSEAVSPAVPGEVPIVEQAILEPSMGRRAGAENAARALRSMAKHRNAYWHGRLCGIRDEDSCNRERPNTPFTGYGLNLSSFIICIVVYCFEKQRLLPTWTPCRPAGSSQSDWPDRPGSALLGFHVAHFVRTQKVLGLLLNIH